MIRRRMASAALLGAAAAAITAGVAQFSLVLSLAVLAAGATAGLALALHLVSRRIETATERIEARLTLDQLQRGENGWRLTTAYAGTPDLIWTVVEELLARRPKVVVELGAGVSTLVLGRIIRAQRLDCRIVSIEHDPDYAARVRAELRAEGLQDVAEVFDAPLQPVSTDGYDGPWYRLDAWIDAIEAIDVLLVDGPPKRFHPAIRSAAVPILADRLAPGALVVLDDARRKPERRALAAWGRLLSGSTTEYRDIGRGVGLLRCGAAPARG